MSYVELQCASHFSFLRGASSCEELFAQAAACGLDALAVTDRNSLAGIVRAHEAARATGVRLIVGCRLVLEDGAEILVYPRDRAGYARLCRLLTVGKRRAGKGGCRPGGDDRETLGEGWNAGLVPDGLTAARRKPVALGGSFGAAAHMALYPHLRARGPTVL
ncbi:PHP domain-containing protein, partial [Brevundimonas sp. EAKA]|uniref:PHP domain-containing protein n=1 Tax=Brevundimonas sp. EAKA TaxID=1495854 RepID=UPI0012DC6053